jgi:hypothetical protein
MTRCGDLCSAFTTRCFEALWHHRERVSSGKLFFEATSKQDPCSLAAWITFRSCQIIQQRPRVPQVRAVEALTKPVVYRRE